MRRRYFFRIVSLIWMAVIFSFSAQDGSHSGTLSSSIAHWLIAGLPGGKELSAQMIVLIIRKGAHMTEYAILAILLFNSFDFKTLLKRQLWRSAVIAVAYAMTDETHQLLVAGRAGQPRDVVIDSAGVIVGLALCWWLSRRRARRASRTHDR
ncbi:VanZ family protein [Pseudoramibacter faecis]|uniref:VanZ family protein n=1 Tax=Pseudoramibacter faecis TaxID=3108534 RepID=UPI002E77E186|nr:VanZ family protein [Pseudoramibacter sp. HA2172]